ncbi:MAG TPA: T9SS type A sorting domain-containing protein, partial [Ignavibacteria bacterium]|nr:T9SS type A sorting domain-containing protein [Ignavibacteria bacterium]
RTTRPVLGIATGTNMAVKFSSPIVLPAGNYWVSIYAVYNTAATLAQGRWNWSTSTTATGLPCHLRDYTGLFGIPPFPWTPTNTLVPGELSHLFALFGTSGPPSGASSLCFNRTGVNLALPDNTPAGVNDTIKVPNNMGTLDDITVVVDNITHTWIGDLTLRLSHGGETDTVISRIGTGTFGNSSDDLMNVRMTDSAAAPIAGIGNVISPSNGSWLPGGRSGVDSLKKHFVRTGIGAAKEMNGNWVLNVSDNAPGDTGRVNAWSICFYSGNITQIISNSSETPDRYTLSQNYPNPFNPTTKINFSIPKAGLVSLKVYDMLGREVSSLVNSQLNAGIFTAEFNGAGLSSGTYFYRLQVGDFVEVKKMVLLK